jgi:hypothetical protein
MEGNSFIGTWRLVSAETRLDSGEVNYPLGRDAVGYLSYHQDGYMAVTIMKDNRPQFASEDFRAGSQEERLAAFDTYFSYCGTYEVNETKVIHRIEVSLFPNWVGSHQERYFEFRGDQLVLRSAPMMIQGVEQTGQITWQRVGAMPPTE